MSAPEFKVYDAAGTYQASTKEAHAAAMLAEHYGGRVKWCHKYPVWSTADPSPSASFDAAAALIHSRIHALKLKWAKEVWTDTREIPRTM